MARRKPNANLLGRKSALRQLGETYFGERYPQREATTPRPSHKSKRESQRSAAEKKRIEKISRQGSFYNPSESAAQYRLAQAVLSGTARQTGMTKKAAREIVDRTPARMRSEFMKRNPVDSAAHLAEAFTGRPADQLIEFEDTEHIHEYYAGLAPLMELEVWVDDRHVRKICFDRRETWLGADEKGENMYVVGGDQTIDLKAFGITGHAAEKDLVPIGDTYSVTYWTAKFHLGKQDKTPGPYRHVFSEHGEEEPELLYDTRNQEVKFAGGEYHIPIDIDGKYSSGINN